MNKYLSKIVFPFREQKYLFVLILIAFVLLVAGINSDNIMFSTIGGALLGSSISSWLGRIDIKKIEEDTLTILNNSLRTKVTSEESLLNYYRQKWYWYYVTKYNDTYEWRHFVLDLSKRNAIGSISCDIEMTSVSNQAITYVFEGCARDNRFMIFCKAEGSSEPVAIQLFPFMGESFRAHHAGICIMKTWDGDDALTSTIISNSPILTETTGLIKDESISKELDAIWGKAFKKSCSLSPLIKS